MYNYKIQATCGGTAALFNPQPMAAKLAFIMYSVYSNTLNVALCPIIVVVLQLVNIVA